MALPTDPDVQAFVRDSLIVQVATLSPKGRPFVTPLWFVVDGGALYITTGMQTRAGKNVAQRPAVALLFSGERAQGSRRCLRLQGTATCHPGLPSWRILLRVLAKYYLSPRALSSELQNASKWRLRQRYYGQAVGGAGYIRVVPTAADFLALP
jgi:nitroimidazol reductase NimA-like FMN-containing flavoprotein (pyridoxamine 5'-phosphate oxidase superfamily)